MKKTHASAVAALALGISFVAWAKKAPASPPAETSATIGGKQVKIDYSAPSAKGRKIFGELVPNGEVWRTGANAATTLTTEVDLLVKDLKVPKGKYTLFTLPAEGGLTLIVNKQTGQSGLEYDAKQDLGRVKMTVSKPAAMVEQLKYTLSATGGNKGKLQLAWEHSEAAVTFTAK